LEHSNLLRVKPLIFKAKIVQPWPSDIIGEVLITCSKISFLGDVDAKTGELVGADLDVKGRNLADKILIFPEGRGSTVGSNVLYGLARNGLAPKLIGTCRTESITISGAIFGGIPMVSSIDEAVFEEIKNGDVLKARIQGDCAILEKIEKSNYLKKSQPT
jgi:predicted aconitase with swiveling domain